MEKTSEKQDRNTISRQRFDDTLMKHMARLLGVSSGPGMLPLNIQNVSCLVLLSEQQANEEKQFRTPEDRYTQDLLFQELAEIGLDSEADFEEMLQQMRQMEYLHIDESGLIIGRKPALKMSRLIDSILPQMPGLNLIAYIAQTIDEVASGRKNIDDAVDQFNQTLMQQGVSTKEGEAENVKKKKAQPSAASVPSGKTSLNPVHPDRKAPRSKNLLSATDYDRLQQAFSRQAGLSKDPVGPRIISSDGSSEEIPVQVVSFGAPPPGVEELAGEARVEEEFSGEALDENSDGGDMHPNDSDRQEEATAQPESTEHDEIPETHADAAADKQDRAIEDLEDTVTSVEGPETEDSVQATDAPIYGSHMYELEQPAVKTTVKTPPTAESEHGKGGDNDKTTQDNQDDVIESRISSFEKNLSMQCPVCKSGEITTEKTAKSKTYYKCLNRACNFISWGKPYHQVCPRCRNPFLIEHQRKGRTVLKCPRSTCNYWQNDPKEEERVPAAVGAESRKQVRPKPRRRVVKRRVVRRKKA